MSHSVFSCDYHLVWPTKYRRKILNAGVQGYLLKILQGLSNHRPDLIIKEVNTDEDHIHILISIPPAVSVGSVVGLIKSNTAKSLNEKFPHLRKVYWGTKSIWSAGYFVSTVGINEEIIRLYIKNQGEDDAGQSNLRLL